MGRFNATTKTPGRATIRVESTDGGAPRTCKLTLEIEETDEVPDKPNDDRENATRLYFDAADSGRNTTVSAELDGPDVDYYAFTLSDYHA